MCTVIVVGPQASAEGCTWLTHSDTGQDSRIRKIPAQDHEPGSTAALHWGLQEIRSPDLADFGEVLGQLPQVPRTQAYLHSAYPHLNEHQLALAESTTSQRPELRCARGEGEQIMTIEQAMALALQRCRHAREAVRMIGDWMETYGFLSSCGDGAELVVAADPQEIWVLEVVGVGPGWRRDAGTPGAIWAARRMPPDHAMVVANWSVLAELDLDDTEQVMACAHVREFAVQRGWAPDRPNAPFPWRAAYAPLPREWATGRQWAFHRRFAPTLRAWPEREVTDNPWKTLDAYAQVVEPLELYPFSIRPERKLAREDLMDFHRSTLEGSIYDLTAQPAWLVVDDNGQARKSAMATPFPGPELRRLLRLTPRRQVARHFGHYGVMCQLRAGVPDDIGAVYWVNLDNPLVGCWLPMAAGVTAIHPSYQIYDPEQFSEDSARWCIDFVDNLMRLEYQTALPVVVAARDAFENDVAQRWAALEQRLLTEPDEARRREAATAFSLEAMAALPGVYRRLREALLVKLTNNRWT